jgi:GntR family transcriptional regulator/MocR family aminotransferase
MLLIDSAAKLPIYEQIYGQIREKIMSGEWQYSFKLPSIRRLASELKVSRNTVEEAYQQLYAEGYLFTKLRRGYYVEKLKLKVLAEPLATAIHQPYRAQKVCCYDFAYGQLDYRHAPLKIWKRLLTTCLQAEIDGLVSYSGHQGERGLRQQIAKYAARYRGVKCSPEQIVIGGGTLYLLGVVGNLLRDGTRGVGFEDPGYKRAKAVFKNSGFTICPIPVDKDGINVQELKKSQVAAVYVTPSHQFPTGTVMPIAKRLELLDWAARSHQTIIEDDYSCHLRYDVRPIPALQGFDQTGNVIYIGNFSKILLPSLRMSFMVLPPRLLEKYKAMYQAYNTPVPFLLQKTLESFMQGNYWDRHLNRVVQVYKRKHDCLVAALTKAFGHRASINGKNAGLFLTVTVHSIYGETELIKRAAQLGVRVYPLSDHFEQVEKYDGKTVLLGYSGLSLEEIEAGIKLLEKAWFG